MHNNDDYTYYAGIQRKMLLCLQIYVLSYNHELEYN